MLKFKKIFLPVRPISKPRPRSFQGQKRPYNPPEYKKWLKEVRALLHKQWKIEPLEKVFRLEIYLRGAERGDPDNRMGSVLDAGKNILWTDDNVKVIPKVTVDFKKMKISESHILVHITWEVDDD